eukprot:TCONS_00019062-protein
MLLNKRKVAATAVAENLTEEERNIINKLLPECMTDEEKEDAGEGEEELYKTRPVPWLTDEVVAVKRKLDESCNQKKNSLKRARIPGPPTERQPSHKVPR